MIVNLLKSRNVQSIYVFGNLKYVVGVLAFEVNVVLHCFPFLEHNVYLLRFFMRLLQEKLKKNEWNHRGC